MPSLVRASLVIALAIAAPLSPARALEPVTVDVEGVVELAGTPEAEARELAFQAALVEAALEVARGLLARATLELEEEHVREALAPGAAAAILTYRILEAGPRAPAADPARREFALRLVATVDAGQVRQQLRSARLLSDSGERPSVLVAARATDATSELGGAPLVALEDYVKRRLGRNGFVIVEPALRRSGLRQSAGALEMARALGADVAVDLALRWRDRGIGDSVVGGVIEVRVRALRAQDGFEVGLTRFDAPAYHSDPAEARARALDAVREQVAENLLLQLERNWQALARDSRPVRLVLSSVTTLAQVDRVRDALQNRLGAKRVALDSLSPRVVELLVSGSLSPGALQDRLTAIPFEGFRLEPVEVARERVELRVAVPRASPPSPLAAP